MIKSTKIEKFYYFFPQAVAVVGVKKNVMPVAWHTPVSAQPPLYGILVSPKRYSYSLLKVEDGFTVNFLENNKASLIAKIGGTSGRDLDKLSEFKIKYTRAEKVNGVIIEDSYAAYECAKSDMKKYGDHYLVIGKIILIHFDARVLNEQGLVDEHRVCPMLYFGKDQYLTIDPASLKVHPRG